MQENNTIGQAGSPHFLPRHAAIRYISRNMLWQRVGCCIADANQHEWIPLCNWCDRSCRVSTELERSYAFKTQLFQINKRQNFEIDTCLTVCVIFVVSSTWVLLSLAKPCSRRFEIYIYTKETPRKNKNIHGDVCISSDVEWICSPKMDVTYVD